MGENARTLLIRLKDVSQDGGGQEYSHLFNDVGAGSVAAESASSNCLIDNGPQAPAAAKSVSIAPSPQICAPPELDAPAPAPQLPTASVYRNSIDSEDETEDNDLPDGNIFLPAGQPKLPPPSSNHVSALPPAPAEEREEPQRLTEALLQQYVKTSCDGASRPSPKHLSALAKDNIKDSSIISPYLPVNYGDTSTESDDDDIPEDSYYMPSQETAVQSTKRML